ncbi:MAG TPA: right-handed parallel beta-helix repeat-containing protein [Puia sp.]|nr:right-handed parallel beta-helix repeat-containing protein [Puia sp.]
MKFLCILLLYTSALCLTAKGRNYFVDANGNDAWDGSRGHPWKTVAAVNRVVLRPGDSVFFQRGQVFTGTLRLSDVGTAAHPVWIGCYGAGPGAATIDGGDSSAVVLYRAHWIAVAGLRLVGAGRKTGNVKDGLAIIECEHVRVEGLDITGFQKSGLFIYASRDIVADGIYAHENGAAGIAVEGPFDRKTGSRDLKIVHCRADDNPGDPTNLTNHSGNGIVCGHCTRLLIESCSATNNGWDMPRIGNGPVGIWCYEADSVTIRHCLAYKNKTSPGAADGGGFDLDGGVTNSVIENCLSYGNQGAGYCIFQYWGASAWHHNVIRNNISEDDGLVSDARGGIYIWNSSGDPAQFYDCQVYNNTVYNSREAAVSYSEKSVRRDFVFYKNIFVGADSLIRGDKGGDRYWSNGWWVLRRDDRSRANAAEHGKALYRKPAFRDPGNTTATDVSALAGYSKYRLPAGSPFHGLGAKF